MSIWAEDVVQESLIKALTADRQPETDEETIKWFYQILRRSVIDVYRKEGARSRALERFEKEFPENPSEQDEQALCECLFRLTPMVPGNIASCWRTLIYNVKNWMKSRPSWGSPATT